MKKLVFLAFIVILAISCKKENAEPVAEPKDYLSKTTEISGTDTLITNFEHNTKGQLSKIIYGKDGYTKIEYYDSGQVAIVDSYLTVLGEKLRNRVVFTYDNSNTIKSAQYKTYVNSLLEVSETWTYKVDSNRVVEIEKSENPGFPTLIYYDTSGNILEVNDQVNSTVRKFTYNDKPSKLINSRIDFYLGLDILDGVNDLLPIDLYNTNDCIKIDNTGFITEYTPEYNEKNLPLTCSVKEDFVGTIVESIITYEYTTQ